jgi:hypothetical protein
MRASAASTGVLNEFIHVSLCMNVFMSRYCTVRAYDPGYMHAFASRNQEVEIQDYKVLVERLEQLVSLSAHFYFHDAPKQTKKKLLSLRIFEYIGVCKFVLYVYVNFRMHGKVCDMRKDLHAQ